MLRVVALCVTVASYAVSGQPFSCTSDDQCYKGYYCEKSTLRCLECLQCIDLKRKPPTNPAHSSCVLSLIDCGPCLDGYVVDHLGDVNSQCISLDSRQDTDRDSPVLPPFVWALIAIGVVITVGVLVYLYRSSGNIKVWVSTSIRSLFDRPSEVRSGEDLPPPYNPDYNFVPNANPSFAPPPDWTTQPREETSLPFIKRAPSSERQDARESSGHQEARVFHPPAYEEQEDDPLSSPEATEDELTEDVHNTNFRKRDRNGPTSWMPEDEDTVASPWTPFEGDSNTAGATTNNTTNNRVVNDEESSSRRRAAPGDAGAEPDCADHPATSAISAAPGPSAAKRTCVRQDTSNRTCDSGDGSSESSSGTGNQQPSTSHNQNLTVININIGNNLINKNKRNEFEYVH